ncbi:unnamed protein product, partial [Iphiclides podalirius]
MIPDNVTLIVKTPNQQIEDQNIECASSWTIKQLKGHLTEIYPSKPSTDEQKIIYSGQLLDDNCVLKDVLRFYDPGSDKIHTMHLVCTPKRKAESRKELPRAETAPRAEAAQRAEAAPRPETRQRAETAPRPETRQRAETAPRPETRQNDQNHTVEMRNYLSTFANNYGRVPPYPAYNFGGGQPPAVNDPATFANQMLMMQQAYIQYMQQYANMQQAMSQRNEAEAREARPPPEEAVEARAPPEEAAAPRDWLDHVYTASRMAILFSLVYLYGSPVRLLLVLLVATVIYLNQMGMFRELPPNEEQNATPTTPQEAPPAATPNRNNLLTSIWIIASSFFASLIPEAN